MILRSLSIWRTLRPFLVTTRRKIPLIISLLRSVFMLRIIESRLGSLVLSQAFRRRKLLSCWKRIIGAIRKFDDGMIGFGIKSLGQGYCEHLLAENAYSPQLGLSCCLLAEFQTTPGKMRLATCLKRRSRMLQT